MSNRLYPTWEQLKDAHNPLTPGEEALLSYLDKYLPKDSNWTKDKPLSAYRGWLIFAQPFLNGSRPDIIIFHPFVGVVIYEVKDWDLNLYSREKDANGRWGKLYGRNGSSSYQVKSPIKQVNHYKEKIIGQLVPAIGERMDKDKKAFGLIKTALYFHKSPEWKAEELFVNPEKDSSYLPILGSDSLMPGNLEKVVPDVNYSNSYFWDIAWNEELLFWFNPPFHYIEQGGPLTLKGNQEKLAMPAVGHHRARGVAGSGKTQALAYRAANLASSGLNVLIISFNITLWHYIKDMIARAPFKFKWDKITFSHFHGFCKDKLNEFGEEWPRSPEPTVFEFPFEYENAIENFFKATVPNSVRQAVAGGDYDKYDAILIDEGQDYHVEWYGMLNELFLTKRDELLVVCDKKQNIYDREMDWIDKRVTRQGLEKFVSPFIDLTVSYRMPQKVAELSNEFSELFNLNQDIKLSKIDILPVLLHSQHIVWLNIRDSEWQDMVYHAFRRLKKAQYSPSDIILLLPSHKHGQDCINLFKEKGIEVNHVFEDNSEARYHPHKKAFWMGDSRLKMSTIHSFKGWELLNIVLYIPLGIPDNPKKLDAIVYTAITRTKENLIVLNSNQRYVGFGEKFPKKWNEQDV
ncbi:nuclease-related domain-containing DEAD/DEAH box helicase [Mucilaginibacter corticis]|uniref:nuclease-related domain-containing DEAD/DEAH box helicase n=1 Tax=Mucilaginibacter corticis TaxID=2597670 RepID=UPI001642C665|nr:nuclease-related domain-containing DEAD/DEAH box helicase [Mucilaginibacter corticis]